MLICILCFLLMTGAGLAFRTLPESMRPNIVKVFNVSSLSEADWEEIANAYHSLSNTSLSDMEKDNRTQELLFLHRERKKQERLISIQAQILSNLQQNRQPNASTSIFSEDEQEAYAKIIDTMNKEKAADADGLILMRSFYASCSIPNNTDKFTWDDEAGFRLYYDLPFNSYPAEVSVKTAKLRLFKKPLPESNLLVREPCPSQITINVYQYLKPLKSTRRERKRLIESKNVSVDHRGWVELNVAPSVSYWFQNNVKNFGLCVEVEDAHRNRLNPNLYFDAMNCTLDTPPFHPFPNIMDMDREGIVSQLVNNQTYPTLDLRTSEPFRGIHSLAEDRVKRSLDNASSCTGELEYISFADVGLDEYIVWPAGVVWTFCEGSCPHQDIPHNREAFFSQWIQRLFKMRRKNSSESSCVVTRRESLPALLYDGENQVFETILEDFVPTNCGCRPS